MKPNRFLYYLPATFTLPCTGDKVGIGDCVSGIYSWSLAIVGLVALVQIIYAGWIYMTAAGNTAKTGQAMHRISNAILGIVLLFSSYIILRTINPDLVGGVFSLPKIDPPSGQQVNTIVRIDNFGVSPQTASIKENPSLNFTFKVFASTAGIEQMCPNSDGKITSDVLVYYLDSKGGEWHPLIKTITKSNTEFGSGKVISLDFAQPVSKDNNYADNIKIDPEYNTSIKYAALTRCLSAGSYKEINRSSPATVLVSD